MGDIIVTTPVVRWLKLQLGAEVHFLIKKKFEDVILFNPYIDRIKIYEKTKVVLNDLRAENYDYIVDLHKSMASTKLSLLLGTTRTTYNKMNIQKWLLTHLKVNTLPNLHLVDRYYQSVKKLGCEYDGLGLDFFIDPNAKLPNTLPELYEVIVLGATHYTKRIPFELAMKIIQKTNNQIVLIGGSDVTNEGQRLHQMYPSIYNLCGKTNLHTSAKIIQSAHKIHTGDTGLMHLSAAMQKDMIVYWGSTAPIIGMFPYVGKDSKAEIENKIMNLWCQPCTKIGYKRCPLGHFNCMKLLKP